MKQLVLILSLVLGTVEMVAQTNTPYITVTQRCPQCLGWGALSTMYGPVRCPSCGGCGAIQATYKNPYYVPSGPSFNSHYTPTSHSVHVRCTTGTDKGFFKVYLSGGDKYIKFSNHWVALGNGYFTYNGNSYVFTYC